METRPFVPTPSTFFTPSLPFSIEARISPRTLSNTSLWLLILFRLAWVLTTFPVHLLLVFLSLYVPSLPLPIAVHGQQRKRWTWQQRVFYPLIGRLIWCGPGTGALPPDFSPQSERAIPLISGWLQWLGGEEKVDVKIEDVVLPPNARREGWMRGEAVDPRGEVLPGVVPCFSLSSKNPGRRAEDDKVLLYFMGGGYVAGSPAEGPRCFDLARETGMLIIGANYRKATSPGRAFPAALQDAITVYAHLTLDLGYKNVVLGGDSAGGGLAFTLLLYLTNTLAQSNAPPPGLVLPTSVLLYSPWVDLSLSKYLGISPPPPNDDLLNLSQINAAANAYLVNTFHRKHDRVSLGLSIDEYRQSPYHLGARHPYLSPALPSSLNSLRQIATAYNNLSQPLPRLLVVYGSAELFAPEIQDLIGNLQTVGLGTQVDVLEEEDEIHVYVLVPRWMHSRNVAKAMKVIRAFLME